jgi:hypothetical protein
MAKRRFIGGVILCLALTASVAAAPPTTAVLGTPPQPDWVQLSALQKIILAPLVKDWDKMENIRKKKWLGIAERYPAMRASEQQRMQIRMLEWATLTSEQRTRVRDTYKDFKQLPPEQKKLVRQKWEAYSNLTAEEKQRLRETGKSTQLLASPAEIVTSVADQTPDDSVKRAASTSPPATEAIRKQ